MSRSRPNEGLETKLGAAEKLYEIQTERAVAAEAELERWRKAMDRVFGDVSLCSRLHPSHVGGPPGRDPDCPVCCPTLRELVDAHMEQAVKARAALREVRESVAWLRAWAEKCEDDGSRYVRVESVLDFLKDLP